MPWNLPLKLKPARWPKATPTERIHMISTYSNTVLLLLRKTVQGGNQQEQNLNLEELSSPVSGDRYVGQGEDVARCTRVLSQG